jgi:hypothetical protein
MRFVERIQRESAKSKPRALEEAEEMLYNAALFAAVCLLVYLVRGDADRRPGPIRSVLLYSLLIGLPLGIGEYRGLARQGHRGAWWVSPL